MTDAKEVITTSLQKAVIGQAPIARKNVERLRRVHEGDSPSELIARLDRGFLTAVTASGAGAGAAGLVPGVGIPAALTDMLAFTEASVLYTLSMAEIYGLHPDDVERRQLLVFTVLLGDSAVGFLNRAVERTGGHWGRRIVQSIPMNVINRANKVLGPRFITKYGTKQGVLVLSKQVPMGIGAALGGGGNHLFGRATIKSAHKIFGPPPTSWRSTYEDSQPS